MSSFKNLILSRKLHEACIKTISNISQPPTWSVHRSLHASSVYYKKHSTDKEALPLAYQKLRSKHKEKEVINVWKNMTVKELGEALHKDANYVLEVMTYVNDSEKYRKPSQIIDNFKVIEHVVKKVGKRVRTVAQPTLFEKKEEEFQDVTRRSPKEYKDARPRPPVVTIMGHVDHGKTTLLDSLRNSAIVDSEFGGITQHIGAFSVVINDKERITFLDTPGHAAFCSMRNRGAQCTDIVILVVAADDGVMEQTIESIKMANEANVPIIVAVNKIDKPQADIERTKKMLLTHGIQVEEMGGDVQMVPISALKGINIDNLMEAVTVQADLMSLKSDYSGAVEGVVIESLTDSHRGKLCTLLVQCGTLQKSAVLVAGDTWCKVRAIFNDNGEPIQSATPSTPVQIIGWKDLPLAGDIVIQVASERRATDIIEWRKKQKDYEKLKEDQEIIDKKMKEEYLKYREQLEAKRKLGYYRTRRVGPRQKEIIETDEGPKLNIIIKADVNGSLEAILDVLDTYDFPDCKLNIVHYGVGQVSKNDVFLAKTFNAIIYSFNTGILADAKLDLKSENIQLKRHNVIYKLVDELKSDLSDLLPMLDQEEIIGEANVLQEFLINEGKNKVPVAGCRCVKGQLKKSGLFKVIRGEDEVLRGKLSSLKHFKNEVDTINKDMDCGLRLADNTFNFKPGDTIICFKIKKISQKVVWDPGF